MLIHRGFCFAISTVVGCYSPNDQRDGTSDDPPDDTTSTGGNSSTNTTPTSTSTSSSDEASSTPATSLSEGPSTDDTTLGDETTDAASTEDDSVTVSGDSTESSSGDPVDTSRVVFVVLDPGAPLEYGGVDGADAICQAAADDAGLSGTYLAWLSSAAGNSPSVRFSHDGGPFVRTDGIIVAADWADLTDSELLAPINLTADGGEVSGSPETQVITHTEANGTFAGGVAPCLGYTADSAVEPERGDATMIDERWSIIGDTWGCANGVGFNSPSLYCFQQ